MKISVLGLGYVGAVSCGCMAKLGHTVIGVDVVQDKIDLINQGLSPLIEAGLEDLLSQATAKGQLSATTDIESAVKQCDAAMLCVGTPSTASGGVNASHLEAVCEQIGGVLAKSDQEFFVVLTRSTSLPPVHHRLIQVLEKTSGRKLGQGFGYVCHPEFLREGTAVEDFHNPPKIVFGASDPRSEAVCKQLYPGIDAPTFFVPTDVAAMVKYADNCFHAVKVAFGNEIGTACKQMGVDSHAVMDVFCEDRKLNISPKYLRPGFAFGGSCLPKDLRAMLDHARQAAVNMPMLTGVVASNQELVGQFLKRVASPDRPAVGIVGLAFKEGTDDVRESPMVAVVEHLYGKGHPLRVYDEHLAMQKLMGSNRRFALAAIPHLEQMLSRDLQAVIDASGVLIVYHKLQPKVWESVTLKPGLRIIDLARVEALEKHPGYEGLHW